MEQWYFDYYGRHPKEKKRQYQLDAYMISPEGKHYVFEFDGKYHDTKIQRGKTFRRDSFIKTYFGKRKITVIIQHWTVEELNSRFQVDDSYILTEIKRGLDRKTF